MPRDTETDEIFETNSEIQDDNDALMQSVLAEFDKTEENVTLQIKVYRVAGGQNIKGQRERFLFYADPSEFPILERVRDQYGTGIYRVRIYKTIGNKTGLVRSFDFDIEAPEMRSQAPQNSHSDMGLVLAAIEKQNQTMMTFMERVLERPREIVPVIDPLAMMERTLGMAANLAGIRPDNAQQNNGMSPDSMISLISKGMELGAQATGNPIGEKETNWMSLIKDFIQSGALNSLMQAQPQTIPVAVPQLNPQRLQQANAIPVQPSPITEQQNVQKQLFDVVIKQLVDFAKQGTDPKTALPWFFDTVPMNIANGLLQDPMLIDRLSNAIPDVMTNRGWFTAFFNEVRNEMDADTDTNEQPNNTNGNSRGDAGNTRNPQSDATITT